MSSPRSTGGKENSKASKIWLLPELKKKGATVFGAPFFFRTGYIKAARILFKNDLSGYHPFLEVNNGDV